jgi:IS5 family transposase
MRQKIVAQPELDFHPSNLKVTNAYFRKYETISRILDENPKIINLVHEDIGGVLKTVNGPDKGGAKFKYSTDTVLRILVSQVLEGLSLRGVVVRIDDSNYLRRFIRIDGGPMMDYTTLDRLKNAIHPASMIQANRLLARYAVRDGLITGESLRLDTTAVETNIHWPTDSSLLWDVYRVLARLIEQARELDAVAVGDKRLRLKRVKKLASDIARLASNKSPSSRKKVKRLHKKLIDAIEGIIEWSVTVGEGLQEGVRKQRYGIMDNATAEALVADMNHYCSLGLRVVDQACRRVLKGEKVPNGEKLFSIFESHTELLIRGKQNKNIEFGHMIQIRQVDGKFITEFDVFEKRPNESKLVKPALQDHKKLFDHYPDRFTTDKGYYESMEALEELEKMIPIVAICKKGKRTPEQIEREHDPDFKDAQRFRAGVEGTIGSTSALPLGWRCSPTTS